VDDNAYTAAEEHNRSVWDARVRQARSFARPAGDAEFVDPLRHLDGANWLGGDIRGKRLLCLAAGGGRHGPLYAAAGAEVTVVDISAAQLALDREVAAARKLRLRTIQASIDRLPMLGQAEFQVVIQPVSTCYVPDVLAVYREVARVTCPGGLYISQHKQPASLQADTVPASRGYELIHPCCLEGPLPQVAGSPHREEGTWEYLHRWELLLGGLCRAGFAIEDVHEPLHADPRAPRGTFAHRSCFVPPYIRLKARRRGIRSPEIAGARPLLHSGQP